MPTAGAQVAKMRMRMRASTSLQLGARQRRPVTLWLAGAMLVFYRFASSTGLPPHPFKCLPSETGQSTIVAILDAPEELEEAVATSIQRLNGMLGPVEGFDFSSVPCPHNVRIGLRKVLPKLNWSSPKDAQWNLGG